MVIRIPMLAAVIVVIVASAAGCGLTSRHTVGPTVDSNGQLGFMFSSALGPVVGCERKIAVPVRAAAAVVSDDPPGPRSDDAALGIDFGVGVDWLLATPRSGQGFDPTADLSLETAGPAGWRLGKRVGLRTGYLRAGDLDAWALGISGTLVLPMSRNLFSLGLEAGCDALLYTSGRDAPWFRCDLGIAFDLTRRNAVNGPVY
jgi:hypothetical protein